MYDLDTENYKNLLNESKEDKWTNMPYSWLQELDIITMSIPAKFIYRFRTITIKISAGFFVVTVKLILKFMCKFKRLSIDKTCLKTLLDFKSYFFFLALLCSLWDLSSPTRDQTWTPCSGSLDS